MKNRSAFFLRLQTAYLQIVILLLAIGALAILLWEPQIEGRNAHATQFQIYFHDPFLACTYIASLALFTGLYQAFRLVGYIRENRIFSPAAITALRIIKFCALTLVAFVVAGEISILFSQSDDRAGGVFMGGLIGFGSLVVAAAAALFQRILQSALAMKPKVPV